MAQILDGKATAQAIQEAIRVRVSEIKSAGQPAPHLAAVLIGDDPASQVYVTNKVRTCEELGFGSSLVRRSADISQQELLDIVQDLNDDPTVHGILVQLPLPKLIDSNAIINAIAPGKDVDGFHPISQGRMVLGQPTFLPATPYGILLMLEQYGIETAGKHCVVIGRSNIVGTPMSVLLSRNSDPGNATVTLTHSKTKNLAGICRQADIIVAAIGSPRFLKADMVKEGAVVIDVGMNRIEDRTRKSGSRLVGDVDFDAVQEKASWITPVPGGVGPMTICGLMKNTLRAWEVAGMRDEG